MIRLLFFCFLCVCLSACAPRGEFGFASPSPGATVQDIWVANFRPVDPPAQGDRSPPRPERLQFSKARISIPPTHELGQIEWPVGKPNAATDFVTLSIDPIADKKSFARAVARDDSDNTGETVLFVHGYNTRHPEAVYFAAQIANDFEVPSPVTLFSWPSAGVSAGYLYDRDSALIARDQLEQVLIALTQNGRKVILLGHSMGNQVIMETLRQIEISGSLDIPRKIESLIMVSPDIDGELFYTQARRIRQLPPRAVIIAARQDSALRISARLTGRSNRLGSSTDRRAVRDLPIAVVDASEFKDGQSNHSIGLTSPSAISIFRNIDPGNLPGQVRRAQTVKITELR